MPATRVTPLTALILDVVAVVVFAALGRASHAEAWTGALSTAWPFLLGAALGWGVDAVTRRAAPIDVRGGVVVWLCTVVGGMILRAVTGQGTATAFVVVTAVVTAAFLLGWRAVAALVARRRHA